MTMTIHSFLPEDERCEVLEVDVSRTRGSSTVFPCGTSGWPLASPQTPSLLQKDEEAYGHDYPFSFPEEKGGLSWAALGLSWAAHVYDHDHTFFQKREDVKCSK